MSLSAVPHHVPIVASQPCISRTFASSHISGLRLAPFAEPRRSWQSSGALTSVTWVSLRPIDRVTLRRTLISALSSSVPCLALRLPGRATYRSPVSDVDSFARDNGGGWPVSPCPQHSVVPFRIVQPVYALAFAPAPATAPAVPSGGLRGLHYVP